MELVKCHKCGAYAAQNRCTCPDAGNSREGEFDSAVLGGLIFLFILFPLLNLPAFIPAFVLSMWLASALFPLMFEGVYLVGATIVSMYLFSFIIWAIFKYILRVLGKVQKIWRIVGQGIIWGYVLLCYGGIAYYISMEGQLSKGWAIAITVIALLFGLNYCAKKLRIVKDEEK